jgi:parvulin-like peptidyl-prolyl isomerase
MEYLGSVIVVVVLAAGGFGGWMYHNAQLDKMRTAGVEELHSSAVMEDYRDEQQKEIQKIYDEWLAGDKTEAHFGELANKYSHDKNGKVTDGGIYTFVKKGEMVAEFNDWCFAEGRKPGDTDLVKTQFGYHVMYFVGSEETWFTQTRSAYISNESNKIVEDTLKQFTIEINYKKIVLGKVAL